MAPTVPGDPPDQQLMEVLASCAAQATKAEALNRILGRYQRDMWRCAEAQLRGRSTRGLDATDVVQETCAILLVRAKAGRFDDGRPLLPWLLRVVQNKARDLIRKEKRHRHLTDGWQGACSADQARTARRLEVEDVFARLSPQERRLCEQFYLEGRTAQEIAVDAGTYPAQVYRELHRIRTRVRSLVGCP